MAGSFYVGGFAPKSTTPDQLLPYCKRISANVKHPSVSYTFIVPKSALSETAQVQKGRRIGISFGKGATEGSNPASYPKTAIGIYGFFNKKSGSKNPEMVDAAGFAPTASKVLGCYGAGGGTRTHTMSPSADFESATSTIPSHRHATELYIISPGISSPKIPGIAGDFGAWC